ncbi:MAG: 4Fe-4S binding protein [Bacteroidota bacterium]|nr:4Fe-4S binding protein [Bacteroidota bacterium]
MSRPKLTRLKNIRFVVSLVFFVLISLLFLDPWNKISPEFTNYVVALQLIPALLKILFYTGVTTIGLIFIILLTFAFGRVYCSTLCPIGTLQDIVIYLKRKINLRERFQYKKSPYIYHYLLFILLTIFTVAGSTTLLNLFEPFSNYGRILTNTAEPLIILTNNFISNILGDFQLYFVYVIPLRKISLDILAIPILFFALIVYMSYSQGRLFCNSLCPAGALLGLISRFSIFKIVINETACNECGACEKVCKANCIESETKRIDFASCIGCFNCIKSCPTSGVIYAGIKLRNASTSLVVFNSSRRNFFKYNIIPVAVTSLPVMSITDTIGIQRNGFQDARKHPISPPGSISIEHFKSLCTACHLCVTSCPTHVLYPTLFDYGIDGILQPKLNYDASFCNYDCNICTLICPSGAILPVDVPSKKLIQIGRTHFVKEDCVVIDKKKECAACAEHCPTKAVKMAPYEGKLKLPELNNDLCTGCGACEYACPTTPRKAIYVRRNSVHLQAIKPDVKKKEDVPEGLIEFPF